MDGRDKYAPAISADAAFLLRENKRAGDRSTRVAIPRTYREKCEELGIVPNERAARDLVRAECDLSSAGLGDVGAKALAAAFPENDALLSLSLRDCDVGPEGFRALAHGLRGEPRRADLKGTATGGGRVGDADGAAGAGVGRC